ncbi:MAG: glycosyltransferase involved in cell wall biosynthesis [Candidatus Omnitrophota bacterium]
MKRILFISKDSPDPYGSSKSFLSVMTHMHEQGCPLYLYTFPQGFLDEEAVRMGAPHGGFAFTWLQQPTAFLRAWAFLRQKFRVLRDVYGALRNGRYEVMYINTTVHVSPLLLGRLFGCLTVVHVREGQQYFKLRGGWKKRMYGRLRNLILRSCVDRFFCVSGYVAETVRAAIPGAQALAIHNGIDTQAFKVTDSSNREARKRLGYAEDAFVMISVGRLHAEKGMDVFVEAAIQAAESIPGLRAIAIGGPFDTAFYLKVLKPLAERAPEGLVEFPGYHSDIRDYYAAADLFIHPATYDEPLARTILEALSMGSCIIASRVGGTPEMIENGVNGILVEPSDARILAKAMIELYADVETRTKLQHAARKTAESSFSVDRYVAEIAEQLNQ